MHRLEQRELHEVLRPAARCNRRLKRSGRTDGCASGASVMGGNIKFTSIYNIQYIDVHIYPNPWEFPSISQYNGMAEVFEHCPYQGIIKEASGMREANTKTYCCRTSRTVFWEDQAVSQATVAE